jgi:type IV pilus assembly protein PilE
MVFEFQIRRPGGFTLVELMITVGIVAVLAAIAYPSYTSFVRRSNRTDATRVAMADAQALQRCYSQNFSYSNSAATPCSMSAGTTTSPSGNYSIAIAIPAVGVAAPSYSIVATPLAGHPQTADTQCMQFTLLSTGQQTATNSGGTDTSQTCWGSK